LASFTERYHELTKYNPHTIDKLGPVHWDRQPPAFKPISAKGKIDLLTRLQAAMEALEKGIAAPDAGDATEAGAPDKAAAPEAQSSQTGGPEAGLENIARLLFFTLGLTARLTDQSGGDHFLRAAPSAGGLYPTEIYVAARGQKSLADGLYHYHSLKSALIPVWEGSFWADLKHYFLGHPAVESSGLLFLFTGIYGRSAWRYKERAYRRILLDTGHALGNLLEVCRATGQDYALLGGFIDAGLEELFFLTPKEEFPLLGLAVGPRGSLPAPIGQYPGEPPADAIKHAQAGDPMQVQQNACERIRKEKAREPADGACGGPAFPVPAAYNPFKTILRRRSCRKFTGASVALEQVREALAYAFRPEGAPWCLASGHLGFHVVALEIEGIDPGVYALDPATLRLTLARSGDFRSETYFMCLGQDLASECAFALVHSADLAALSETYGDRGYRYACMDAGQIGERLNLWGVHQGLGSSGIGGYYDDQANELLGLPLSNGILYISLFGAPAEE
jgi:SagB-type dehydrogenase family enzyme